MIFETFGQTLTAMERVHLNLLRLAAQLADAREIITRGRAKRTAMAARRRLKRDALPAPVSP